MHDYKIIVLSTDIDTVMTDYGTTVDLERTEPIELHIVCGSFLEAVAYAERMAAQMQNMSCDFAEVVSVRRSK